MFLLLITLLSLVAFLWHFSKDYNLAAMCKRIKSIDGINLSEKVAVIPSRNFFGNNFDLINVTPVTLFEYLRSFVKFSKGKSYLLHFFRATIYNITNAEDAEEAFQSMDVITKGIIYQLIQPFLGDGLLLSTDKKWHFRRKMLTPAFHFNILQTFMDVFKEETQKAQLLFETKVGAPFALTDVLPQFTLNTICETALGVKLDDIPGSVEYRHAIHDFERITVVRSCQPAMYYPILFRVFGKYNEMVDALKVIHEFSSGVINKRRKDFQKSREGASMDSHDTILTDAYGQKKRYAMLETLLYNEEKGLIDHQGICDEVDTFMFEGYDTTSTCLTFAILNLANFPDIQEKCYQEIKVLGDLDSLTMFDYNGLEYLECVIKETLRLYPSVPFISRQCVKDTILNGLYLPEMSQINIHIFDIHRDERHFPDPLKFKPERFEPQNSVNRHPFAFVPFSAGPRNCIGQKFAILEIKVLLVELLRRFKIKPVTRLEDVIFENGFVLRTNNTIKVQLEKR